MLLLHHDHHRLEALVELAPSASARPRIYETCPVAAEARGLNLLRIEIRNSKRASPKFQKISTKPDQPLPIGALTWICTTNLRLRRAACRTHYTLRAKWHP